MSETFAPRLFFFLWRGLVRLGFPPCSNKQPMVPAGSGCKNNFQIIRITRPDAHTSLFARSWLNSWGELRRAPTPPPKKGFADPSGVCPLRGPCEAAAAGRIGPLRGGCGVKGGVLEGVPVGSRACSP